MTPEEFVRKWGDSYWGKPLRNFRSDLRAVIATAVAKEREECALIAEDMRWPTSEPEIRYQREIAGERIATTIRARGEPMSEEPAP